MWCPIGFLVQPKWSPRYVLDAGANVGLSSRIFAALWPHATVVSLEPGINNFAMLQLNAAMAPNIHPRQVLLSNSVSARPEPQHVQWVSFIECESAEFRRFPSHNSGGPLGQSGKSGSQDSPRGRVGESMSVAIRVNVCRQRAPASDQASLLSLMLKRTILFGCCIVLPP